ncbi:PAS domain-containing sensor histidine kinase [Streptomyces showdoensis]|uniref:sensor histidine kinase n=1 Tax=Streptomyces showdoensis TaxID=68268 RepID=UPI000F514358|nr:PAS domain-containing sensor histidine kinase [Streptomyces showdoensis]
MYEASQEQLSLAGAVLDALPQAAMLVDRELRIVRVNRRLAGLLRLPEGLDLSPGTPRDLLLDHVAGMLDRPEERRRFLEEARTRAPVTRIADYHLGDGRTLRRRRTPVGHGDGFFGHLWLIEDVTRQHEAEEDMYEQVRKLAALADERAAFAGRVLHELRTPLATVLSFAELLLEPAGGPLDPEQAAFVDAIHRNARRMQLVAENLPNAAAGTPPAPPHPSSLAVHELIERVTLEALQRSGGAGPYLAADCPADGPPLVADAHLLTGALEELVANALRYTPEDGRVEIVGRTDGEHWTIQVRDTGIGVPLEYQEEIFTPFVRAPNARRGGFPGTGLGLASALDAVRLHGGTLTVRDRENRPGAVFTVRLPVGDGGAPGRGASGDGGGPGRGAAGDGPAARRGTAGDGGAPGHGAAG